MSQINPVGEYRPTWENRKRAIFSTMGFCAFWVSVILIYIMWTGEENSTLEVAVMSLIGAGVLVLFAYAFGVLLQHNTQAKAIAQINAPKEKLP